MATTISGVDYKSAPKDYAALYQTYFRYIVNLVARQGIDANNKEDVAADILTRLIQTDILDQFDPDYVGEYQGERRPANFKSFLGRKVTLYVLGYLDKQKRLARRELQICDLQMGEETSHSLSYGEHDGTNWADLYGDASNDLADEVIELVQFEQDARHTIAWLKTRDRRSATDTCDLPELFDAIRKQVLQQGYINVAELKVTFGMSSTAMYQAVFWLKQNLAVCYGRDQPVKRRRVLRNKAEQ